MLEETASTGSSYMNGTGTGGLLGGARLDEKAGKALRVVLAKLMKERFKDSYEQASKALAISGNAIRNILGGSSNGSLETARRVAVVAKHPLADIVGEELAKLAKQNAEFKRREQEAKKKAAQPAPPPSVRHLDVSATGARVGEAPAPIALTKADLDDLRKGIPNAAKMAVLVAEYERLIERDAKLSQKVVEMMLRDPVKAARVVDAMLGL